MKLYDLGITAVIAIVVAAAVVGYASQKWLGNDNPVEQEAEAIIKTKTGITIDLSP